MFRRSANAVSPPLFEFRVKPLRLIVGLCLRGLRVNHARLVEQRADPTTADWVRYCGTVRRR